MAIFTSLNKRYTQVLLDTKIENSWIIFDKQKKDLLIYFNENSTYWLLLEKEIILGLLDYILENNTRSVWKDIVKNYFRITWKNLKCFKNRRKNYSKFICILEDHEILKNED